MSRKTKLLLLAGALFFAGVVSPASAGFAQGSSDVGQLMSRINQLETQIQTLSRAMYRGGKLPEGALTQTAPAGMDNAALAVFEDRLSQIESRQRDMTGQVERLQYDVTQMKETLDKALADNEMRFQQMQGAGATASAPQASYAEPQRIAQPASAVTDTADSLYDSAFADIREAKYDSAEVKFRSFMEKYSSHALAPNAQYWLAETHYVRADYKQSARLFAQCYQDYPRGPKASDSLLKLGMSLAKLGKKEDACLSFQQLQKDFPGDASPVNRRALQEMKTLGCK